MHSLDLTFARHYKLWDGSTTLKMTRGVAEPPHGLGDGSTTLPLLSLSITPRFPCLHNTTTTAKHHRLYPHLQRQTQRSSRSL